MAGNVGVDLGVNAATKGIFGSGGNTQQGPNQSGTPGQDQNWWTPDQQTDPQSSGQPQSTQQTVPPVQASAPLTPQAFASVLPGVFQVGTTLQPLPVGETFQPVFSPSDALYAGAVS